MRKKIFVLTGLTAILGVIMSSSLSAQETEEEVPGALTAAIFVRNRAGDEYDDKAEVLGDLIGSRLTSKGFSVLDRENVVERFERIDEGETAFKKLIGMLTGQPVEDAEDILKDASALRLAQMIGADYIIVATLDSIGHTTKKFKGKGTAYGVDNEVTDYVMRISLEVLEAARGGSVYGDVVQVVRRIAENENLEIETSDIVASLIDRGAERIAENIEGDVEKIRQARKSLPGAVGFTVSVNGIEGATITLDGAVLGTTGEGPASLQAAPGIHIMRITRQWFIPWEKPVNISEGQILNVTLKLSEEGIARFEDLEGFKTAMAIAKEKEDTSELAEYEVSKGERKKREESYIRLDTSNAEDISIGDNTPRIIIEEED